MNVKLRCLNLPDYVVASELDCAITRLDGIFTWLPKACRIGRRYLQCMPCLTLRTALVYLKVICRVTFSPHSIDGSLRTSWYAIDIISTGDNDLSVFPDALVPSIGSKSGSPAQEDDACLLAKYINACENNDGSTPVAN